MEEQVLRNKKYQGGQGKYFKAVKGDSIDGYYSMTLRLFTEFDTLFNAPMGYSGGVDFEDKIEYAGTSGSNHSLVPVFYQLEPDGNEYIYYVLDNENWKYSVGVDWMRIVDADDVVIQDDAWWAGNYLVEFDIDSSKFNGSPLSLHIEVWDDTDEWFYDTTTLVTDYTSLDVAINEPNASFKRFPLFRVGDKLYCKVINPQNYYVYRANSNCDFLTFSKVITNTNVLPMRNYAERNSDASNGGILAGSFTVVYPRFPTGNTTLKIGNTSVDLGASQAAEDMGTANLSVDISGIPQIASYENTSSGVVFTLTDNYYLTPVWDQYSDIYFDHGIIFAGDTRDVLSSIPRPTTGVSALDSQSELVYIMPTASTIGFNLYSELEGSTSTEFIRSYVGTPAEVITQLEANGFALDKSNLPLIGLKPPVNKEIIVYNESGATIGNTYFPSTILYIEEALSEEVFWCPQNTGLPDYSFTLVETLNDPKHLLWSEQFSVTSAVFDQEVIVSRMVNLLNASSNLSKCTITNYEYYLGIKY